MPDWNDRLASLAIGGANTSAHDFSSAHGSLSSGDDLDGIKESSRRTSSAVTSWNDVSDGPTCCLDGNSRLVEDWRVVAIHTD